MIDYMFKIWEQIILLQVKFIINKDVLEFHVIPVEILKVWSKMKHLAQFNGIGVVE